MERKGMSLAKRNGDGAGIVVGDALGFLRAVYLNPSLPLPIRMRAAEAALPFEKPKLAVTAHIDPGGDWAERLGRAVERSNAARLIEHAPAPPPPPDEPVAQGRRHLPATPIDAPFPSPRRR